MLNILKTLLSLISRWKINILIIDFFNFTKKIRQINIFPIDFFDFTKKIVSWRMIWRNFCQFQWFHVFFANSLDLMGIEILIWRNCFISYLSKMLLSSQIINLSKGLFSWRIFEPLMFTLETSVSSLILKKGWFDQGAFHEIFLHFVAP